ncbi:cardiolipin synthase [Marinihelvus fidelis]|uniref:Cardiolipin synthase n=2 Tax=Marinihelvus fidelis TaxID=2613842 RepID=A0A5N0TCC4_9GAMM|nr:cardiolipin synthase [Marinihelvus fidelis]
MLISTFVTLFYILGWLSAANAVMTARTAQGAIAWSISLVTFPFVAVPAYWVFGRSKFEGFLGAYDERRSEIDALVADIRSNMSEFRATTADNKPSFAAMERLTGAMMTGRNAAELLINGDATFDSIFEGIERAESYILVQFYMFHDDGLGRRMRDALVARASEGIRVLVLYDEVGSSGLPDDYVESLRQAGVEVSSFNPTQGLGNRFQLNFRNHRKIVVVDGRVGWVGGHNVGDEYLGLDPEFSPWRDTHVRLEGPVAVQLQAVFLSDWYWATRQIPVLDWQPKAAPAGDTKAMIVASAPTQQLETAGLMFVDALSAARERIWLSAPYFVPDEAVMKALELAALRGVDVRILMPGKGDSAVVFLAGYHYVQQLRGLGITFYEYRPGFLHEKVGLVDNDVAWVGTANFDNRSFRLNFEVTALIHDDDFVREMEAMFEADFQHATTLDPESLDERGFFWRLGVSLSRLAAPVL